MKKDEHKTRVFFKMFKGDVIAVFPDMEEAGEYCQSYMHVGQHGESLLPYMKRQRNASIERRADLIAELESIGYNLDVIN